MAAELTKERFQTVMEELGVELDFDGFVKLIDAVPFGKLWIADELFKLAHEALHGPHGYAWEYASATTRLVARDGDRLVIGVQDANAKRPFPPWGWKIERWSKDLAKNRDQVTAWARTETKRVIVGKLVRAPARAEESTASDRDDGAALIAAVVADPDDAAARLVYADWLLERGDQRGELIRLHQEGKDARELIGKHAPVILAPYASFDAGTRVSSGFIEELSAYAGKLAKHPEVFAREPFRHLHLVAMKPDELTKLARTCGHLLARITTLHLEGRKSPKHLMAVPTKPGVLAPLLSGLTKLRIERLAETVPEWRALLAGLRAPIEALALDAVPHAVFEVLDEPGVLPALRHIELGFQAWANNRGRAEAVAVAKGLARRNLASVLISSWHPGSAAMAEVVEALLAAPRMEITLDNCTMDGDTEVALAKHARVSLQRIRAPR